VLHDAEPTDESLAVLAGRGDLVAFGMLYDRYAGRIHAWAVHTLGVDAADDALQEVFARAWRGASQFDPVRGRYASWLMAIARHHLGRELSRRGRHARATAASAVDSVLAGIPDPGDDVADHVDRIETARELLLGLRGLPSEQRQTIVLAYFGGFTQSEIARLRGIPLGTVKKRIRLGMQKLRRALEGEGIVRDPAQGVDERPTLRLVGDE
jgi:RNA polymerase sigma-70 factor (ECF subfamily)